jgi:HlyD family secretion protein
VIDLTSPPATWAGLRDGFRVDARIVVFRADAVLTIPSSALFRDRDGWAVFVVEDGHARLRTVTSSRRSADTATIEAGVAEGETVIVYPGDAVAHGVRVAAR